MSMLYAWNVDDGRRFTFLGWDPAALELELRKAGAPGEYWAAPCRKVGDGTVISHSRAVRIAIPAVRMSGTVIGPAGRVVVLAGDTTAERAQALVAQMGLPPLKSLPYTGSRPGVVIDVQ